MFLSKTLYSRLSLVLGTGESNARGNPAMVWRPIQGGVEIFLHTTETGDKRRPDGPSRLVL